jgi:hypothetical protein
MVLRYFIFILLSFLLIYFFPLSFGLPSDVGSYRYGGQLFGRYLRYNPCGPRGICCRRWVLDSVAAWWVRWVRCRIFLSGFGFPSGWSGLRGGIGQGLGARIG